MQKSGLAGLVAAGNVSYIIEWSVLDRETIEGSDANQLVRLIRFSLHLHCGD